MFSIIIPTWNNLAYVKACVDSIRRHSAHPHEIILHVNEGSDGTLEWARSSGIRHSFSEGNVGICLAVNEAAAMSQHEFIVYFNDDMIALPGWDTALLAALPADPLRQPCMLSATMIEPAFSRNPCVIVADYGTSVEGLREDELLDGFMAHRHGDWCGSTWPPALVHRRWWHLVGGYSVELSPGMASDTDFAMKMWMAGCRHFQGVGASRVYHFQCKSTGRVVKNDGAAQFLAKWGVSQSSFGRHYLRRGEPWSLQALQSPPQPSFKARWSTVLKRRFGKLYDPPLGRD